MPIGFGDVIILGHSRAVFQDLAQRATTATLE